MSAPAAAGRVPRRFMPRLATARIRAIVALATRLAAFFAMCTFATFHWAALFDPAPDRRLLVVALIATCCGAALALSASLPRRSASVVRIGVIVLMLGLGLVAAGIRAKLLVPSGWGTLSDRLSGGMAAVGSVASWPYAGPNTWLRLTTLAAAPLTATFAATLAFWPVARHPRIESVLRFGGLAALVLLYGIAAAARSFGHQGLRGAALLACIAAWLWLPRLRGRDALAGVTAIVLMGAIALGLTGKLASPKPWVDYRHWQWTLHKEKPSVFDWRHTYGPIRWQRKGETLLLVKSKEPHYWRAETLDRFDGTGWTTQSQTPRGADIVQPGHRGWNETVQVTVRGLRSQLVIGPGTPEVEPNTSDPSMVLSNEVALVQGQLKSGDTYTYTGYVPDPTVKEMRASDTPDPSLLPWTTLDIPDNNGFNARRVEVPLRGSLDTGNPDAVRTILDSPYVRDYRLARRLAVGATTNYDVVKQVGAYLEGQYSYTEHPPRRKYPLDAFLFQDKAGYCQHFSGAAALMLRMLGIPSRVVSGFTPGSYDPKTKEYVVHDLDAHSWIEVWFDGIGWVPFDPTPAVAPAASQSVALAAISAARGNTNDRIPKRSDLRRILGGPEVAKGSGSGAGSQAGGGTAWAPIVLLLMVLALALSAAVGMLRRRMRRRRPPPPPCGDPDVDYLIVLLTRLGLEVDPRTTLLALETRLQRLGGPEAAGYARVLRERRFGTNGHPAPARAERRRLRQLMGEAVAAGRLTRLHLALPESASSLLRPFKLDRKIRSR